VLYPFGTGLTALYRIWILIAGMWVLLQAVGLYGNGISPWATTLLFLIGCVLIRNRILLLERTEVGVSNE